MWSQPKTEPYVILSAHISATLPFEWGHYRLISVHLWLQPMLDGCVWQAQLNDQDNGSLKRSDHYLASDLGGFVCPGALVVIVSVSMPN